MQILTLVHLGILVSLCLVEKTVEDFLLNAHEFILLQW